MFKRGVIVLVPFPFTDLSAQKLRPALIISAKKDFTTDVIVVFITSKVPTKPGTSDIIIRDTDTSFAGTGLKASSVVRVDKIATLDRRIVLGEIGRVSPGLMKKIDQALKKTLGLS